MKTVAVVYALLLFVTTAAAACDPRDSSDVNTSCPIYRHEPGRILVSGHAEDELMKDIIENMNSVILAGVLTTQCVYFGYYFVISPAMQCVYFGCYFIINPVNTKLSSITQKRNVGETTHSSKVQIRPTKAKEQDDNTNQPSVDTAFPIPQANVADAEAVAKCNPTNDGEWQKDKTLGGGRRTSVSHGQANVHSGTTNCNAPAHENGEPHSKPKSGQKSKRNKRKKCAGNTKNTPGDIPGPLNDEKVATLPAVEMDKAIVNNSTSNERDQNTDTDKNCMKVNGEKTTPSPKEAKTAATKPGLNSNQPSADMSSPVSVNQAKVTDPIADDKNTPDTELENERTKDRTLGGGNPTSLSQDKISKGESSSNISTSYEKGQQHNKSKKSRKRDRRNKRRKSAGKSGNTSKDIPGTLNDGKVSKLPAAEKNKAIVNNSTSNERGQKTDTDKNCMEVNAEKTTPSPKEEKTAATKPGHNSNQPSADVASLSVTQAKVTNAKADDNNTPDTELQNERKKDKILDGKPTSLSQVKTSNEETKSNISTSYEKGQPLNQSKKSRKRDKRNKRRKSAGKNENTSEDIPGALNDKINTLPTMETDKAIMKDSNSKEKGQKADNYQNYINTSKSKVWKNKLYNQPRITNVEKPGKGKETPCAMPHRANKVDTATLGSNKSSSSAVKPQTVKNSDNRTDKKVKRPPAKSATSSIRNLQGDFDNNRSVGENGLDMKPTSGSSFAKSTKTKVYKRSEASPVERNVKKSKTNPHGLKTMRVPNRVVSKFLEVSENNTNKKNIETFGALCGKMDTSKNAFALTHLVIPKQIGTADSCEPTNLEELITVQDKYGVIMLGWIHTHPTQTAFLSSVDCHTQCNYQLMFPEMLAIVCSPRYNETGFYHLDPDYGLSVVANCRQTGFHPHKGANPPFTDVGHIEFDPEADITSIDLRAEN